MPARFDWREWAWPAAVIAVPTASAAALAWYVGLFLPDFETVGGHGLTGLSGAALGAAELSGRLAYVVTSLLAVAAALGGIAYGFVSLAGATSAREFRWIAGLAVVGAPALGLAAFSINASSCAAGLVPWGEFTCGLNLGGDPGERTGLFMREVAVDHVFAQIGAPEGADRVFALTALAVGAAGSAVGALGLALAAQSRRPRGSDGLRALKRRRREVQRLLLWGALILTLATASTRAFYHWPLGMLDEESAAAWSGVVSAATAYWGLFYTVILVGAVGPATLALRRDVLGFAGSVGIPPAERPAWADRVGLHLAPRDAVFGAIAAAAPVISSPLMDLLGGVIG